MSKTTRATSYRGLDDGKFAISDVDRIEVQLQLESKSQFEKEVMKEVDDIKKEEITKIENVKIEDMKKYDEVKIKIEEIEQMEDTEEIKNGQDLDENSMEFEKPLTKTASTSNLNISFRSDDKTEEEEESPQFEPIDIMNLNESNLSNDSHLSGISELTSHRSRSPDYSNEFSRDHFDLSNHDQDSQLSKVSSNSRLSIVTDFGSSNQASSHFPIANEDSKDKSRDNFRAIRDVEEGKYKESKFNFESIKNKSSSQEKDTRSLKSFSSRENSRDEADSLKEKNESKDGKDKNESFKSKIPKSKTESKDSKRHRDRDRKKKISSSSSRHSKSSTNDRDHSREGSEKTKLKEEKPKEKEEKKVKDERKEKEDKKEKDERKEKEDKKEKDEKKDPEKKDPEKKDLEKKDQEKKDSEKQEMVQDIFRDLKDIYKEKIRELREKKELTEKEKLSKDSKTKDSKEKRDSSRDKKEHKKDHRTSKSSDRHEKSSRKTNKSKDKDKKRDEHRSSKDSKSSRSSRSEKEPRAKREGKSERSESRKDTKSESQSKEKKQREEKKKAKDDHSSLRKNSNDRRSTDRDGSNGSNSRNSQKTTSTGKSTTTLTKETSKTNSGGDTSDGIEDSQGNNSKLATAEFETQEPGINSTLGDIQHIGPENSLKTDSINSDTSALNEAILPLKKRPFHEDSSSLSPSSSAEKVKKPKFAKNFHEARKLMKIRRRMEKQNSDQDEVKVNKSEVEKFKVEGTGNESLSNSPFPEEDITKVPDEERVQIIQVPDEECEEPYSEEMTGLTLEETSMIILEGQILGQSQQKESKLSLMERSIRQSLDEMMSDQKLAENAERNIKRASPANLKEDALQIENVSSEKDIETVKEAFVLSENDKKDDKFGDKKSLEDEADENVNLEKLEKGAGESKDIPEEGETVKFLNQQEVKVESEEKEDPQNENANENSTVNANENASEIANESLSPKMELRVSMGIKQSTEDLMRNIQIENSPSSEKCSQEIGKESNRSPDKETVFENNLEVMKEVLSKSKEHSEDKEKYEEKLYRALSPVEEDCLYLEPDNERAWRFARFLESFEKKLNLVQEMKSFGEKSQEKPESKSMAPPQLKRKLSSSPLSDILLQNANNNNDGVKEGETEARHEKGEHGLKRRKLGRPKKQRPSLSSFNPPGLLNGENFVMPLSPESDVSASSEKTSGQPIKEEKSRTRNNQRYSSDDLYKPRPLFSSSSRRNRRSNQA